MKMTKQAVFTLAGLTLMATSVMAQSDIPGGVPAATRDISGIKAGAPKATTHPKGKHKKAKPANAEPAPAR